MQGNTDTILFLRNLRRQVPGYAFSVGRPGEDPEVFAGGHAVEIPSPIDAHAGTLFDCASLTKPLITAALALTLAGEGIISLSKRIRFDRDMLPFPFSAPTVRELLEHRGGFPSWVPLSLLGSPEEVLRMLPALQERHPGKEAVYSCPGYILLGIWMARITCSSLEQLAKVHLFQPLHLTESAFFPLPDYAKSTLPIAATELGNQIEQSMAGGQLNERPSPIHGEVHDGNCHFLGGACGNAGLFATCQAVHRLASHLLRLLPRPIHGNRPYVLGLRTHLDSPVFLPGQMGHTGFTGTMVVIDPRKDTIGVLLTNRLHKKDPPDLTPVRRIFSTTCHQFKRTVQ
ncbi:MAG TPA: serine hydrolase domain-containing protein [Thermoanaerobaculia bacterium]|nr:serine hydrolase domain-containing protein [Thermoanaerobaculia bacterium]HUM28581.1 serine hydrolase domain-containing protein [Thermoanaerobaculia bacterium]HXK66811.1 serine hydrolase domain-containing protein [Thermoanaerobaculia bacterium]